MEDERVAPEPDERELQTVLADRGAPISQVLRAMLVVRRRRLTWAASLVRAWLRDSDITQVDSACETLAALGDLDSVPDLLDLLRPEAEDERRINCVVDPFGWYEPPPRESAAAALAALGVREAIPALAALLDDRLAPVRDAAARALGSLEAEEAREALAARSEDPDERVREAVRAALARLG